MNRLSAEPGMRANGRSSFRLQSMVVAYLAWKDQDQQNPHDLQNLHDPWYKSTEGLVCFLWYNILDRLLFIMKDS